MTQNEYVLKEFYKIITPNKVELFEKIAAQRTKHIIVALENIQQDHNASAVMRSMDCLGYQELHLIEKNNRYEFQRDIALGAARWLDVIQHQQEPEPVLDSIQYLRQKGYTIVATTPHKEAYTPQNLPLDNPIALFFGAEKHGISDELTNEADYFVKIPMHGFTESYNVSVSAAIIMSALRTRMIQENLPFILSQEAQTELKISWCEKILNGGPALAEKYRLEFQKDF